MRIKEKLSEILVVLFCLFTFTVGLNIIIEHTLPFVVIIFTTVVSSITLVIIVLIVGSWMREYRERRNRTF
jgi:hypothetical protein